MKNYILCAFASVAVVLALAFGTRADVEYHFATTADLTSLNASNLTSGTVPDARFPATLPAASGANLTALNASNLGSGTIPFARYRTMPSVHVTRSTSQTIPNADVNWTSVTFDTERHDTDTMHSVATNTENLVATTAGKYLVWCNIAFAADADGLRGVRFDKNDSGIVAFNQVNAVSIADNYTAISCSAIITLAANDYVELKVYQTSGGDLAIVNTGIGQAGLEFGMTLISP
jgi:hypothetical protein